MRDIADELGLALLLHGEVAHLGFRLLAQSGEVLSEQVGFVHLSIRCYDNACIAVKKSFGVPVERGEGVCHVMADDETYDEGECSAGEHQPDQQPQVLEAHERHGNKHGKGACQGENPRKDGEVCL